MQSLDRCLHHPLMVPTTPQVVLGPVPIPQIRNQRLFNH